MYRLPYSTGKIFFQSIADGQFRGPENFDFGESRQSGASRNQRIAKAQGKRRRNTGNLH
jgi:hypothetical protein